MLNSVVVDSGRTTDVAIDMKVGGTAETIDVSASATQLAVTSNEVGTTISNNLIQNLPYAQARRFGRAYRLILRLESRSREWQSALLKRYPVRRQAPNQTYLCRNKCHFCQFG